MNPEATNTNGPYTMTQLRAVCDVSRIENLNFDDMLELAKELPDPNGVPSHIVGSKGFHTALKTWVGSEEDRGRVRFNGMSIFVDRKLKKRQFKIISCGGTVIYEGVLPTQSEFRRHPTRYS